MKVPVSCRSRPLQGGLVFIQKKKLVHDKGLVVRGWLVSLGHRSASQAAG